MRNPAQVFVMPDRKGHSIRIVYFVQPRSLVHLLHNPIAL